MKKLWLCLGILVCGLPVAAAEADHPAKVQEQKKELRILEKNIRLEFKAVPLGEGDKGTYIITAFPDYQTGIRLQGEDGTIDFAVSGQVKVLEDGRIFVRYDARTLVTNKKGSANFIARSGVVLRPGEELGVSRMGDKTLMIRASYVEPKGASE